MSRWRGEAYYCHLNWYKLRRVADAFFAFDLNDARGVSFVKLGDLLPHFRLNLVRPHQNVNAGLYDRVQGRKPNHQRRGDRQSCLGVVGREGNHDAAVRIRVESDSEWNLQIKKF